ncbi:uncharacterized protein N7500_010784 [Penicillium coprophilum]|uniref:uncharacterized protein n=1 Tax=Penicillium coprophilum TaxID=36646 RepID=UPI00238EA338|nr:uncharacterized protein N7500_010784 [Penicillium coprophilum]KAJ5150595.1 hypothetical protein N7500_010784 [Penicillium coprophilum]
MDWHSEVFDRIQLQHWTPCPTSPIVNLFEWNSDEVGLSSSVTLLRENDNVLALRGSEIAVIDIP